MTPNELAEILCDAPGYTYGRSRRLYALQEVRRTTFQVGQYRATVVEDWAGRQPPVLAIYIPERIAIVGHGCPLVWVWKNEPTPAQLMRLRLIL